MTRDQVRNRLGGLWLEALAYKDASLAKQADFAAKNKFVVFGQGRTGSRLLTTMLNDHSQIHCDNEILYHKRMFPRRYVRACCVRSKKPVYGFKVKHYQLTRDQKMRDPRRFLDDLVQEGWKMVHLYRSNYFRHALSGEIARARGLWHAKSGEKLDHVTLDPKQVEGAVREKLSLRRSEEELMKGLDFLKVEYESDLMGSENQKRTIFRICEYLGVPPEQIVTALQPTTSKDLSETIANYAEVHAHLQNVGLGELVH